MNTRPAGSVDRRDKGTSYYFQHLAALAPLFPPIPSEHVWKTKALQNYAFCSKLSVPLTPTSVYKVLAGFLLKGVELSFKS